MASSNFLETFQTFENDLLQLITYTVRHSSVLYNANSHQSIIIGQLKKYLDESTGSSENSHSPRTALNGSCFLDLSENLSSTAEMKSGEGGVCDALQFPELGAPKRKEGANARFMKKMYPVKKKRFKLGMNASKKTISKRTFKMESDHNFVDPSGTTAVIPTAATTNDSALAVFQAGHSGLEGSVDEHVSYVISDGSWTNSELKPCPICSTKVVRIVDHIRGVHKHMCKISCLGCKQRFLANRHLIIHIARVQHCQQKYVEQTGRLFKGKTVIRLKVPRSGFQIKKTGKISTLETYSESARKRKFTNITYKKCPHCGKNVFGSFYGHIREYHGSEGLNFECETCQKRFSSQKAYSQHVKMTQSCFLAEKSASCGPEIKTEETAHHESSMIGD